jgi:hypothetical protein
MSSSSKRRQTMAKMTRERAVQEKRQLKAQKKEDRKRAAAEAREAEALGLPVPGTEDGEDAIDGDAVAGVTDEKTPVEASADAPAEPRADA